MTMATRMTALLPALRQAAFRPALCQRTASFSITFPQSTSFHTRRYWSSSSQLSEVPEDEIAAEGRRGLSDGKKDALDVLEGDSSSQKDLTAIDPDLDIDLPFNVSADRSNQPQMMNIPPQEDPLLHFISSRIMNHGNRAKARRIVSRTLLYIHAYTRAPALPILRQAIFACSPSVRLLSHRHSTKTIYKPVALSEKQGVWYAVRWLLEECKGRQGGPMLEERLAREIIKIVKGESKVLEKKEAVHKMAMVNRGNILARR